MLGNFSFGDYFKEEAIALAWNLITKEYGLAKDKLLVTVFHTDDEAAGHWKKIAGLSESKIIRIPTSDNFWAMGDTGPCGPCSEIFYDHGEGIPGGPPGSPDQDGDRFIEIWNLVFMQFEQQTKETRVPLPKPSIDTGMGLERLAAVLQHKHNNYDIDLFRALIEAVAHETGVDPDGAAIGVAQGDRRPSARDLVPDRRRRAALQRGPRLRAAPHHAPRDAPCAHPRRARIRWSTSWCRRWCSEMGDAYPELGRAQPLITETLKLEETRFKKTLGTGLKLLEDETRGLSAGGTLKGDVAFKLYDTFGFPLDLTQDVLRARDIAVDTAGFEKAMDEQRAKARAAWAGSGDTADQAIWFDVRQKVGATEFLGYDTERAEGKVTAIDRRRQGSLRSEGRPDRLAGRQPDAVLCASRAASRAIPAASSAPMARPRSSTCRRWWAISGCPSRDGRQGRDQGGRRCRHDGRCDPPRPAARASFGDASAARGAAPPSRHARHAEGLAGRARPAALRHQPHQADLAGRAAQGRGRGERAHPPQQLGRHAPDDAGRGDRRRRHGAVRREVWRRSARALDGRRARREILRRAVRRHACAAHRRHRPVPHRRRRRGLGRRPPHRGAGGQRGRAVCAPPDRPAERRRPVAEGAAGGSAGAAGRRWSMASARSSASWARRARRWRWPAAAARAVAARRPTRCARSAASR